MQDAFGVEREVSKGMFSPRPGKNATDIIRRSQGMAEGGNPAKHAKMTFRAVRGRQRQAKNALARRQGKPTNPFDQI